VPTNKWIVFGHHFATISGPGPLVGPTLAAQFGFLPGALWIIVGVAICGAVQDFVILAGSVRRERQVARADGAGRDRPSRRATALLAVLGIMIIIVAVLGLVVVNALREPVGHGRRSRTMPVALFVGSTCATCGPAACSRRAVIGLVLLILSCTAAMWVREHATLGAAVHLDATTLAWALMIYGFIASVLPVWLLLAPRDYISAFVKIGVVVALAIGILLTLPPLQMPALTQFTDGTGRSSPASCSPSRSSPSRAARSPGSTR
jgi:carbon starvation protein